MIKLDLLIAFGWIDGGARSLYTKKIGVAKLPIEQVVKALYPFYGALLLALLAVTCIAALSLWLPRLMAAN